MPGNSSQPPSKLNPQVLDTLTETQKVTLLPKVLDGSGAGKAYLAAAQTIALAVQDSADNLRSLRTISTSAIGTALAKTLADPDKADKYGETIAQAQGVATTAGADFKTMGSNAAEVLKSLQAVASSS